ncbi:hypothetical protein ABZ215_42910 [Amycolatopsis sp. NPDC006131]|uniref:hypothetical protein n=1 Tax=Amycolatopsis sp. NPDC006131 TaxID=3156731 RepID=UPI0033A29886
MTSSYLIDPVLFDRLVNRIAGEHDLERGLAERIMDQALTCGAPSSRPPASGRCIASNKRSMTC